MGRHRRAARRRQIQAARRKHDATLLLTGEVAQISGCPLFVSQLVNDGEPQPVVERRLSLDQIRAKVYTLWTRAGLTRSQTRLGARFRYGAEVVRTVRGIEIGCLDKERDLFVAPVRAAGFAVEVSFNAVVIRDTVRVSGG